MPGTANSLENTNIEFFIRNRLSNLDTNIAALSGGSAATVKVDSVVPFYDTTGSRTLFLVTYSDGSNGLFSDAGLTTTVPAAGVTPGPAPASGAISQDAGGVDATTTRVKLTTEDEALVSKTGSSEWVKDVDTDTIIWQESVYDASTGLFTYTYLNAPGGTPFIVGSTVTPASVSAGEVVTVAKVDDVAGDQSGALVNYIQEWTIDPITGDTTLIGTKTQDLSADYTVLGTPRNATDIGVNARTATFQVTLPVGTWTPDILTESFAYGVYAVGDANDPPTFTDSDGNVDNLFVGESANYSLSDNTEALNINNIAITVKAGDTVKVYGTKYSA